MAPEIDMLKNVRTGLSVAWQKDMEAEREKGMSKMRDTFAILFDISAKECVRKATRAT
jgi:hypothetical protein